MIVKTFTVASIWFVCLLLLVLPSSALAAASGFSFSFSPDSTRVVTFDSYAYLDTSGAKPVSSSDTTASLWDAHTGKLIATLRGHHAPLESASFSPDGTRIVTASEDTTARLWDGRTGALLATLRGNKYALDSAAFSPDGARIVTVGSSDNARLWDGQTGKLIAALAGKQGIATVAAFSPDGARLATSGENALCLWDGHSGSFVAKLPDATSPASEIVFSPDSTRLAIIASGFTPARLWDAHTGKVAAKLNGASGNPMGDMLNAASLAFSPDSARVAIAGGDGAYLWDGHTGQFVAAIQDKIPLGGYPIGIVLFSPDSAQLITGNIDRSIALWDGRNGARIASLQTAAPAAKEGTMDGEMRIALSPDGKRLVMLDTTTACLRDAQSGRRIAGLSVASNPDSQMSVHPAVSFSPDGSRFITSNDDSNTGRLWDGPTGTLIATLKGHRQAQTMPLQ